MNEQFFSLSTALCLPAPEIEALIKGQTIAAMIKLFIRPAQRFALYPANCLLIDSPLEHYYKPSFLPLARLALNQSTAAQLQIKSWARCEFCQVIDNTQNLEFLSQLTLWTAAGWQAVLQQQKTIFLAYLRVYLLPEFLTLSDLNVTAKVGKFVRSPKALSVTDTGYILQESTFNTRRQRLEKRLPPIHPELELLHAQLASLSADNSAASHLQADIETLLDWRSDRASAALDSDLVWIEKIAQVGNSSDGDEFEKLVRRSLIKLGFSNHSDRPEASLNPNATGGAGGLDFYCTHPYPVVGECKATKSEKVPDGTPAQLIKLGYKHLQQEYEKCVKLVLAAGELTYAAKITSQNNHMNVIRPETLQELVELKAQYPGAINLLDLKKCLESQPLGELANEKIKDYIEEIKKQIELRSRLIQAVKQLGETGSYLAIEIKTQYNAIFAKEGQGKLENELVQELLIELSSPLAGYLGREKDSNRQSDRFYFLRDLI